MAKEGKKKKNKKLREEIFNRMLQLATSGFGLVSALAWNDLIKDFISTTIKPIVGDSSNLISKLIYAVIVTVFAVVVTYNLARLSKKED